MKKALIRIGWGLLILVAALTGGLWSWSTLGNYEARPSAREALASDELVSVRVEEWIILEPRKGYESGLIFYPGGLVEPEAYAPVLKAIAAEGYLVVITPMPLNLAIFNTGAANTVFEAFPEIEDWSLAGHSLGGTAASIFAEENGGVITGLALWDSFPADFADLSDNDLAVISIFGTLDGLPNTEFFDEKRGLLPAETDFQAIEGANHAQFGDYGPQTGDVAARITRAEQHAIVTELMLEFLARLK